MTMWRLLFASFFGVLCSSAQFAPLPAFDTAEQTSLRISQLASPREPWTVAGENGAVFGRQDGAFEAWIWPTKILSHFQITVDLQDYAVPIDVNQLAAHISVTPAETVITYSHAAFTIRQHSFAPRGLHNPATGAVVFFEMESVRPMTVTFSFSPEMLPMWPAPQSGLPDGEWIKVGRSGFYVLHTDNPKLSGIVAMPDTVPGIMPPYQERPHKYPLQLKLTFDPKVNAHQIFPLIMGVRDAGDASAQLESITRSLAGLYEATQKYYADLTATLTSVETPDPAFDSAIKWAEIAVDQMQVRYGQEVGMVAGYYESADSARPGYAWFFGRDTLWTTYAINSYGEFALTREALRFLINRQRPDGKIMHEFSQSANSIDWQATPYFYASADSTPLLVMAMWDYLRASGDAEFVKQNWAAVRKAYEFERAHDSDKDGIYDNSQGTGWVESWPPGMPHQEVYLAALDQQSCTATWNLASAMQDQELASSAQKEADRIGRLIEDEYLDSKDQFYAFSRNPDGSLDTTASIYSAVAWWQGSYQLSKPEPMLSRWASPEFSTDWGTRDISGNSPYFDPISYHQGSVWPLFTGWVSLAEYRAGRSLSAYDHLEQNVRLTWLQDLGSATELLSGAFYQPLGRSSSHQMWSSAMILAPALRGLFGLQPNAVKQTLSVDPHLPARWNRARVTNLHIGTQIVDVTYERTGPQMKITATTNSPGVLCLTKTVDMAQPCQNAASNTRTLLLRLPPVEIQLPDQTPLEGDATHAIKVLDQRYSTNSASFRLSAPGGTEAAIYVRKNDPRVVSDHFPVAGDQIHLKFPPGAGYETLDITFHW